MKSARNRSAQYRVVRVVREPCGKQIIISMYSCSFEHSVFQHEMHNCINKAFARAEWESAAGNSTKLLR